MCLGDVVLARGATGSVGATDDPGLVVARTRTRPSMSEVACNFSFKSWNVVDDDSILDSLLLLGKLRLTKYMPNLTWSETVE